MGRLTVRRRVVRVRGSNTGPERTERVDTLAVEEPLEVRHGSDVLTTINGSLPGSVVKSIIPSADTASSFNVTYRLTEDDQLRDASMTGRFYPDTGNVTYLVKITTSDKPVTIKVP